MHERIDLSGPFRDVLSRLRIRFTEKGSRLELCCPFHDDRTPSSGVYKSSGVFYCYSCDLTLNAAQFYARATGEGEVKANQLLEARHGSIQSTQDKDTTTTVAKVRARIESTLRSLRASRINIKDYGLASEAADHLVWLYQGGVIDKAGLDSLLEIWYNNGWEVPHDTTTTGPDSGSLESGAPAAPTCSRLQEGLRDLLGPRPPGFGYALGQSPAAGADSVPSFSSPGEGDVDLE